MGRFVFCQWIEGDLPVLGEPVKCNRPTLPRSPYCAAHQAQSRMPTRSRRNVAARLRVDLLTAGLPQHLVDHFTAPKE